VVENVRGAEPWVGRAAWSFGSYYLWGDVPALMPNVIGARKNPGFRFDGSGKSFQSESVHRHVEGVKVAALDGGRRTDKGKGARFTSRDCGVEGQKTPGARKAAAAKIAKIPFALSSHIARVYHPRRAAA
jgi:hypothetical protein